MEDREGREEEDYYSIWQRTMNFTGIQDTFYHGTDVPNASTSSNGHTAANGTRGARPKRLRDGSPPMTVEERSAPDQAQPNLMPHYLMVSASPPPSHRQDRTLESLANHVQEQFRMLLGRIIHLEGIVHRLAIACNLGEIAMNPVAEVPLRHPPSKEISRGNLDRVCIPVLKNTAEPSNPQLSDLANELFQTHSHIHPKMVISQIRKWFRKRREEMGARVISAFKRLHVRRLIADENKAQLLEELLTERLALSEVIEEARLELTNQEAALAFARMKCVSFLKRQ